MAGERRSISLAGRLLRRVPLVIAVAALAVGWIGLNLEGIYFRDALAYWRPDFADLYGGRHVGVMSTYLYSPAFAQVMWPLGLLPWEAFAALWSGLNLVILAWLAGPYLAAVLLWIPGPVADEISTGNIHLILAAAIVIGFSRPAAWAFPLLTKITPGVGLLYFAGERRWRPIVVAVGATVAITAISFATVPGAWIEWIDTLRRSADIPVTADVAVIPGPLWGRLIVAAVIAILAGMKGWRWLVPIAATVALPVPWSSGLALLVGSVALSRWWWSPRLADLWSAARRRAA